MAEFAYRARTNEGRIVSGRIAADSRSQALNDLRMQGLTPWQLQPIDGQLAAKGRISGNARSGNSRHMTLMDALNRPIQLRQVPSNRQLSGFIRQLAGLLTAGLPVDRALILLSRTTGSRDFARMIEAVYQDVRRGVSLSVGLGTHVPRLPVFAKSMIEAGEASGHVEGSLQAVAEVMDRNDSIRSLVRSALAYPVFMLSVSLVAVITLLTFVVPRFLGIFSAWDAQLPLPTRILVSLSGSLATWGPLAISILFVSAVAWVIWARTSQGRLFKDALLLRIPILGRALRDSASARLVRTLGVMLQGGVSLPVALQVGAEVTGNARLAQDLTISSERVKDGAALSQVWRASKCLPPVLVELAAMGEEAGDLDGVFAQAAELLEGETRQRVKYLTALFEPILILVMAIVIGFIVLAILLPTVNLTSISM